MADAATGGGRTARRSPQGALLALQSCDWFADLVLQIAGTARPPSRAARGIRLALARWVA